MVIIRLFAGILSGGLLAALTLWGLQTLTLPGQSPDNNAPANKLGSLAEPTARKIPAGNFQSQTPIPVLCYHGNFPKEVSNSVYNVFPADLDRQFAHLKKLGYQSVSMDQYHRAMTGQPVKLPAKPVLITFDDGKKTNWTVADPLLKKHGLRAVAFIYPTFIINKRNKHLKLTWDELRRMVASGRWDVESHTYWHPFLFKMTPKEQAFQFRKSREELEKRLGIQVRYVAYPFGGFNPKSIELLKEQGYAGAFTVNTGANYPGQTDIYRMKRFMVYRDVSLNLFQKKLETPAAWGVELDPAESEAVRAGQVFRFRGQLPGGARPDAVKGHLASRSFSLTWQPARKAWEGTLPALPSKMKIFKIRLDLYRGQEVAASEELVYNQPRNKKYYLSSL